MKSKTHQPKVTREVVGFYFGHPVFQFPNSGLAIVGTVTVPENFPIRRGVWYSKASLNFVPKS